MRRKQQGDAAQVYSNKATDVNLRVLELDLALHQTKLGFDLEELEARMRRAIVLCVYIRAV
jgi:hypothetical protein